MNSVKTSANVVSESESCPKTAYRRPELVVFGSINEFTAGGGGSTMEGRAMTAPLKRP